MGIIETVTFIMIVVFLQLLRQHIKYQRTPSEERETPLYYQKQQEKSMILIEKGMKHLAKLGIFYLIMIILNVLFFFFG